MAMKLKEWSYRGMAKAGLRVRSEEIDLSLDETFKTKNKRKVFNAYSGIRVPLLIILFLCAGRIHATASVNDLNNEISVLKSTTTQTVTDVNKALSDFKNQINLTQGVLVLGGIESMSVSTSTDWPITFLASTFSVTTLQMDLVIPSSFTVGLIVSGPAALASGKSVIFSTVNGTRHLTITGVAPNPIPTGVVALVSLQPGPSILKGYHILSLMNPVATDGSGANVPVLSEDGLIEVQ